MSFILTQILVIVLELRPCHTGAGWGGLNTWTMAGGVVVLPIFTAPPHFLLTCPFLQGVLQESALCHSELATVTCFGQ